MVFQTRSSQACSPSPWAPSWPFSPAADQNESLARAAEQRSGGKNAHAPVSPSGRTTSHVSPRYKPRRTSRKTYGYPLRKHHRQRRLERREEKVTHALPELRCLPSLPECPARPLSSSRRVSAARTEGGRDDARAPVSPSSRSKRRSLVNGVKRHGGRNVRIPSARQEIVSEVRTARKSNNVRGPGAPVSPLSPLLPLSPLGPVARED